MIEKNRKMVELPIVGMSYVGKHGEKLTVTSIYTGQDNKLVVGYWLTGPRSSQQSMGVERFLGWAKDDPNAKPPRPQKEINPFAEMRTKPCGKEDPACSRWGFNIDGKFHCDNHYVVAERGGDGEAAQPKEV